MAQQAALTLLEAQQDAGSMLWPPRQPKTMLPPGLGPPANPLWDAAAESGYPAELLKAQKELFAKAAKDAAKMQEDMFVMQQKIAAAEMFGGLSGGYLDASLPEPVQVPPMRSESPAFIDLSENFLGQKPRVQSQETLKLPAQTPLSPDSESQYYFAML